MAFKNSNGKTLKQVVPRKKERKKGKKKKKLFFLSFDKKKPMLQKWRIKGNTLGIKIQENPFKK